jgi:hypothetical protein
VHIFDGNPRSFIKPHLGLSSFKGFEGRLGGISRSFGLGFGGRSSVLGSSCGNPGYVNGSPRLFPLQDVSYRDAKAHGDGDLFSHKPYPVAVFFAALGSLGFYIISVGFKVCGQTGARSASWPLLLFFYPISLRTTLAYCIRQNDSFRYWKTQSLTTPAFKPE